MYRLKICSSFIMLYFLVLIIVTVECKERNGQATYQTGENWTKMKTIQIVDGYITGGMRLPCKLKFISLPVDVKLTVDIFEDEDELKKCENLIIESKAPEEATIILSSGVFAFPSIMKLGEMDLRSSNKTIIQVTKFEKKYEFGNIQLEGNIKFENPEMLTVDELYAHTDGNDLTTIVSFMTIVVKNSVKFYDLSDDYKEVPVSINCNKESYAFFLRKCMFGKDSQVTCEENDQNIRDVTDLAYRKLANMEICNAEGTKERQCEAQESEACFCKDGVTGDLCDKCKNLFYTFNSDPDLGCTDSGCDKNGGLSYDNVKRECQCKEHVTGANCTSCRPGSFGFGSSPDKGCRDCHCHVCDAVSGTCHRKYLEESLPWWILLIFLILLSIIFCTILVGVWWTKVKSPEDKRASEVQPLNQNI